MALKKLAKSKEACIYLNSYFVDIPIEQYPDKADERDSEERKVTKSTANDFQSGNANSVAKWREGKRKVSNRQASDMREKFDI